MGIKLVITVNYSLFIDCTHVAARMNKEPQNWLLNQQEKTYVPKNTKTSTSCKKSLTVQFSIPPAPLSILNLLAQ